MKTMLVRLWNDDCGAIIASEYLFFSTILVIGIIVGLTNVRDAINAELSELANAFLALSQGYALSGVSGCSAVVDGSQAIDNPGLVMQPITISPAQPSDLNVLPCH